MTEKKAHAGHGGRSADTEGGCRLQRKIQYLKRYADLNAEINYLQYKADKAFSSAFPKSPQINDMPRGGSGDDKMQSAIERKIQYDIEINQKVDKLVILKRQTLTVILSLKSHKQRRVLWYRYIKGYNWRKIAIKMNYSYRSNNAKKIHKRAIQNIVLPIDVPL